MLTFLEHTISVRQREFDASCNPSLIFVGFAMPIVSMFVFTLILRWLLRHTKVPIFYARTSQYKYRSTGVHQNDNKYICVFVRICQCAGILTPSFAEVPLKRCFIFKPNYRHKRHFNPWGETIQQFILRSIEIYPMERRTSI